MFYLYFSLSFHKNTKIVCLISMLKNKKTLKEVDKHSPDSLSYIFPNQNSILGQFDTILFCCYIVLDFFPCHYFYVLTLEHRLSWQQEAVSEALWYFYGIYDIRPKLCQVIMAMANISSAITFINLHLCTLTCMILFDHYNKPVKSKACIYCQNHLHSFDDKTEIHNTDKS